MGHAVQVREQIRELAGKFLAQESSRTSLITVTDVRLSRDFKRATIYFTVYPEDKEHGALEFLLRKRPDFREYVAKNSRMNRLPFFDFKIDGGEKNRQRIDELSSEADTQSKKE